MTVDGTRLRGEQSDQRRTTTWRPVTDDCRVRHVEGPTLVDITHETFRVDIALVLEGSCVLRSGDGGRICLPRASLALDLDSEVLEVPAGARVGLATFRSLIGAPRIRESSPELPPFASVDRGLCRAVERFVASVLVEPPKGALARHLVERTVRDLVGALILDGRLRPATGESESLYSTARHHILDHCTDPDLGATRLAAAFGVSERHLARAFADNGTTISRTISHTRASVATAILTQKPETGLAEVCRSSGFPSQQAMRRAFTNAGLAPPSQIRALAAQRHRAANRSSGAGG